MVIVNVPQKRLLTPDVIQRGLYNAIDPGSDQLQDDQGINAKAIYNVDELLDSAQTAEREQQAILEVSSVEQSYQEALFDYVEAKHEQVDRVEDKLETLIEKQQSRIQQIQSAKPGVLVLPGTRRAWQDQIAHQHSRLQVMQARLEAVREIRDGMGLHSPKIEELAERKLRRNEQELTNEFDSVLEAQRRHNIVTRKSLKQSDSLGIAPKLTLSISPGSQ